MCISKPHMLITIALLLIASAIPIQAEERRSMSDDALKQIPDNSWSLIVMPDTQVYAWKYPDNFIAQTRWIASAKKKHNIQYVLHLGDMTEHNSDKEWEVAQRSMAVLDEARIPYVLTLGNHDMGDDGKSQTRDTLLGKYFSHEQQAAMNTFGGAMTEGSLNNTFHLFEAGGKKWIVLSLEWAPTDEIVAWANSVMDKHQDRHAILVTHAYMFSDDRRYDHTNTDLRHKWNPHSYKTPGSKNDGQQLWDKLVSRHRFHFTLNGHVLNDGTGYLQSTTDKGNTCHQILTNYQMRDNGGEGFLKIMEFDPDGTTVRLKAYSPIHDRYLTEIDQSFVVTIDD